MYIPDRACKGNQFITAPKTKNLQASKSPVAKLYTPKIKGSSGKKIKMKMLSIKMARVVKITEVYDPPIYFVQ